MSNAGWNKFVNGIKKHTTTAIFTGIFSVVGVSIVVFAKDWVQSATQDALVKAFKSPEIARAAINILDDSVVGASYQSFFILGGEDNAAEHYIPIYISSTKTVEMFLLAAHSGSGDRRTFEVSVDEVKVPLDPKGIIKDPTFQKDINLTSYIKKSKEMGIHEQDEKIYTISFRIDPTQKTKNTISIKVLLNVHGLSKIIDLPKGDKDE